MNHTDKEFGEATPNKKVPTIQDGDFTLFEWYCYILVIGVSCG